MCYAKPGPRCTEYALKVLRKKKAALEAVSSPTAEHIARIGYEEAKRQYYETTGGLEYLRGKVAGGGPDGSMWQVQLLRSENSRATRLGLVKMRNDMYGSVEPTDEHQEEGALSRTPLTLSLVKDPDLPSTRYLDDIAPLSDFEQAYAAGLIDMQEHPDPDVPYVILNYSRTTQFSNSWNPVTVNARGLIVNKETGEIVARPFRKFFNYNQQVDGQTDFDTSGPVVVSEKMDGSMGILYSLPDGSMSISTRGSMDSEQAHHATELYNKRYAGTWQPREDRTYICEILYPENRIVVNYGGKDDVVLIGVIDRASGRSIPLNDVPEWGGERTTQYGYRSFAETLQNHKISDASEGVVVYFLDNDERLKVKGEEYLRLHKLITGMNTISVWEKVSTATDDSWIADMPDEFAKAITTHANRMRAEHARIYSSMIARGKFAKESFMKEWKGSDKPRKDFVEYLQRSNPDDWKSILPFALDEGPANQRLSASIWRQLRPHGVTLLFDVEDDS